LRAYGNAIVAPLAAEFIRAYMEMISWAQKVAAGAIYCTCGI